MPQPGQDAPTPLAMTPQDPVPSATAPRPAVPVPPGHPPAADHTQTLSSWPPAPPGPPPAPPRQPAPPRPPGGRRPRGPLIAGIVAAAVILGGGGAAVAIARPFSRHETAASAADTSGASAAASPSGHGSGSASGAAPGPAATSSASAAASVPGEAGTTAPAPSPSAATASASATPARVTERQAATSVAGMLALSTNDRSAIMNAVGDVNSCGPGLNGDPGVFTRAAASRRSLLARLARLPGRSALPAALVTDLTRAWQASAAADGDFARWANDEIANGCVPGNTSDPGFQAAAVPDKEATLSKKAFTALWNPIAARYHLPRYQWKQL